MGFDDNGLATERFVEKKCQTKAHLMKRSEFIALCLKESFLVEKDFETLWKTLGLSVDWSKIYTTISSDVRAISQYSFIELFKKGYAYRMQEPALYCTTCRTSVAQAEVDNIEVTTHFSDIEFNAPDGSPLIIATTRPELLPACVALFYHPDDARYKHLAGKTAQVPVFKHQVPILSDEKVDPVKGTGLVMCCTFGDQTDIFWYKKHKLPFVSVVGRDGRWTDRAGVLTGLTAQEARKKIFELLTLEHKLHTQKTVTHSVNTHERCKQEIEYLVLSQWFIKILEHKEKFLELGDQVNWKPAFMKARYRDWVQNLNWDWCISRQRFFGIPFPVWHCTKCAQIVCADQKDLPIDPQEKNYPGGACPACGGTELTPETDVMDTWNTSSLTPQINCKWPGVSSDGITLPMGIRPQAHDIIRTWAFYTIVKAYYHNNSLPWKNIVLSGHVLAGKEKISKSKENSKMAPESLLTQYPADVVRYWTANGKLGTDTAFSENQLKIGQRLLTKLWNAFRFFAPLLNDYKKPETRPELGELNEWVLHSFAQMFNRYRQAFDDYEYQAALEECEKFFWSVFCDNYLELVKDIFFNPEKYSQKVIASTQYTLYEVGFGLLQLFAPFIPYITDTIYQKLYKTHEGVLSLHVTVLTDKRYTYQFDKSAQLFNTIIEIIGAVRKLKSDAQVSLKTPVKKLNLCFEQQELFDLIKTQETLLKGITNSLSIDYQVLSIDNSLIQEQGPDGFVMRIKV
jgi:valyl-tRNA synthetase